MLPDINTCNIAVIGLGYVGLPLAIEFSNSKLCLRTKKLNNRKVFGFDINKQRVEELKIGFDSTNEISKIDLDKNKNLHFTTEYEELVNCDVFVIAVPTPINKSKTPDLENIIKASKMVGLILEKRSNILRDSIPIIIYESTGYPGMTEEVCVPLLTKYSGLTCGQELANKSFLVGYSPERINPGDKTNTLTRVVKVTSGCNDMTARWIDNLYGSIINAGTKLAPSIKIAEAAKVIENTQRDLNIALINELAIIFNHLDIDTLDVLEVASSKWNFLNFKPGLVGGHCIGVDPYYLTYKSQQKGYYPEVVLAGRRINDNMAYWIVEKIIKKIFTTSPSDFNMEALILGFTFKENCSDIRNTKVLEIKNKLEEYNIKVDVIDPCVNKELVFKNYGFRVSNDIKTTKKYKLVILAVAHSDFISLSIDNWKEYGLPGCLYFDIKGIIPRSLNPFRI